MPTVRTLAVDAFVAEFGRHVDAQAAALFVGAGVSRLSGYPSWSELTGRYAKELDVEIDDLPLLVQYYQDSRSNGVAEVRDDIIRMVRTAGIRPCAAHDRMLDLPIPDIWTTNWDELIERAATKRSDQMEVYSEDEDLAESRLGLKRLYKMHGTVGPATASRELVISRDHFESYPNTHPRFWQLLGANFLTRSFLFLGFSLTDPNISQIFRLARLYTPAVKRPHYVVFSGVDASQRKRAGLQWPDFARVGVQVVEVDRHEDIATVLERLVARCRPPRAYVSGSTEAGTPAEEWTHAFADELGRLLAAELDVRLMSGGVAGSRVGYAMCQRRHQDRTYHSDDFVVIRRVSGNLTPPMERWGSMMFDGEEAEFLRSKAFERVRAVLVLGGSDKTRKEIQQAKALGLGVIPVGGSGGAAGDQWRADITDLSTLRLGERGVDRATFEQLGNTDPIVAAHAAVGLIRQALFLA